MRVMIHKPVGGLRTVVVVPGRRAHLAPILIRGTDKEKVRLELANVVAYVAGAEGEEVALPSSP